MPTRRLVLPALAAALILGAASPPAAAQEKPITVFAAASMTNALNDINAAFTKATGLKVVASYAASSALMKQIEQGAPADVFASADLQWMDYGSQKKLIKDETRVNLLGNTLVLIAPNDFKIGDVKISPGFDLAGLAGSGRIVTGDVRAVPVGIYAKQALEKLGGATITFVSNIPGETQTISAAIYTYTQMPRGDAAAGRLVLVAIAIALAALIAAEWLARRAGTRFHGE